MPVLDEPIVRIIPRKKRMGLPLVGRVASVAEEVSVPKAGQHRELGIPTFCVRSTRSGKAECEEDIRNQLYPLGLPYPEMDPSPGW